MNRKRYLLIETDGEFTNRDWDELAETLRARFGDAKLIPILGCERMKVVKTDNRTAPLIRSACAFLKVGGSNLISVSTSGSLGKLKSLAKEVAPSRDGQVPQR